MEVYTCIKNAMNLKKKNISKAYKALQAKNTHLVKIGRVLFACKPSLFYSKAIETRIFSMCKLPVASVGHLWNKKIESWQGNIIQRRKSRYHNFFSQYWQLSNCVNSDSLLSLTPHVVQHERREQNQLSWTLDQQKRLTQ